MSFTKAKEVKTLTIEVIEAKNIKAADSNMFGRDSSDAYCKVYLNQRSKSTCPKTKIIKKTVNPVWNETFELHPTDDQIVRDQIHIQLFDKDSNSKDDYLGEVTVSIAYFLLKKNNNIDAWFNIEEPDDSPESVTGWKKGQGQIHLRVSLSH